MIFFGFVNNENRAENDFLKSELSSDFHSRTHQKEIKRLNLSMEGGINRSIDCFFFGVFVNCAVCGCEFISGGPSLVGFDPVTVLKNYYGQQLSGDLKI